MKRLMLGLVPFLAVNVCGMGIFGGPSEKDHEAFIKKIYADAGEFLGIPPKLAEWDGVYSRSIAYVKKNDKSIPETALTAIKKYDTDLRAFLSNFAQSKEETLGQLKGLIEKLEKSHAQYSAEVKEIQGQMATSKNKRWARDVLASLLDVMKGSSLNLQKRVAELLRAKSDPGLGVLSKEFLEFSEKFKKQSSHPGYFDQLLASFRTKRFVETSTDKQFDLLVKRIAEIGDEKAFGNVLHDVHEYAKKHNPDAHEANKNLHADTVKQADKDTADGEAKKIEKSFFTSRNKRYPYELYAKLWGRALTLQAQGKVKPKS